MIARAVKEFVTDPPVVRIFARYIALPIALVAGFSPEDARAFFGDPDVIQAIGVVLGLAIPPIVEGFYVRAKRLGGKT